MKRRIALPFLVAAGLLLAAGAPGAEDDDEGQVPAENPQVQPVVPQWAPADQESQVRLKPGEYTIDNLLTEILVQTGNHLSFLKDRAPKGVRGTSVRIEKEQTGFWDLVDMICDAGGLTCFSQPTGMENGLKLLPGKRPACPAARCGPALLRVRAVESRRDLQGALEGAAEVRLEVELLLEPRLVDKNGRGGFTFADAETGRGAPRGVLKTDAGRELGFLGLQLMRSVDYEEKWSEWNNRQLLRFPAPPAGTKSLSAELVLSLKVGSEPRLIRLDLAAGQKGGRADGVDFSVFGYVRGPASAKAGAVTLHKKGRGVPVWDWPWDRFRDRSGQLLRTELGGGLYGGTEGETRNTLQTIWRDPQGPPAFLEAAYYLRQQIIRLAFKVEKLPWSLEPGKAPATPAAEPKVEMEDQPPIPHVEDRPPPPRKVKPPPAPEPIKRPDEHELF